MRVRSCDGRILSFNAAAIRQSRHLRFVMRTNPPGARGLDADMILGRTLEMVRRYFARHGQPHANPAHLQQFDQEFVNVDIGVLVDLTRAALWFGNDDLFELCSGAFFGMVHNRDAIAMRNLLLQMMIYE